MRMGVVSGNDWVDSFLNAPVKGTPGEAFEYNSMNTYLLSAIIQERTGMKMVDYLRPRLFEPLGIRKVFWESCPAGITKGGWGLFLCPEDAAKLGVMYVNGGKFEGKQIVPAEWVAASTSVHATPPEKMGKYGYGYQVWMEERPGSFAFNGMLGQNVLGYPDTGVVIVTNAGSNELFQTCEMLDIVRKYFGAEFGAELNPARRKARWHIRSWCRPAVIWRARKRHRKNPARRLEAENTWAAEQRNTASDRHGAASARKRI